MSSIVKGRSSAGTFVATFCGEDDASVVEASVALMAAAGFKPEPGYRPCMFAGPHGKVFCASLEHELELRRAVLAEHARERRDSRRLLAAAMRERLRMRRQSAHVVVVRPSTLR